MDTSLDITRARPRHTWLCILEADLQPLNLGLNSAWKCTQDREHWKHLVEIATLQLGHACHTVMTMGNVDGTEH